MKGEIKNFLVLFSEQVTVSDMNEALSFLDPKSVEIWTEVNLMEITTQTGAIVFEDLMRSLRRSDHELLEQMNVKQVYACDYPAEDAKSVQKIMTTLLDKYQGKLGTDTEDFTPFLSIKDI